MTEAIPNWLKKRAFLTPQRTALIYEGETYTFQNTYDHAIVMTQKLAAIPVTKGDFVGVLLKNHPDTVMILYALQMIGATAVIFNNRLTQEELAWQLDDSDCTTFITEKAFEPMILSLKEKQTSYAILFKEELSQHQRAKVNILNEFVLDNTCTIMYTSGTTGFPKGVMQTYGNHWWSSIGSALNLGLTETDRWLCTVPLFHISGYSILIRSLIYGMPIILHDGFDEYRVIEDIHHHQVTIMSVVSTMLNRIVRVLGSEQMPSSFRCMLLGGGPASLALLNKCADKGIPVFQTYGMTETSSQIVTLSPEDSMKKIGSAGKPLFPSQLKIVDRDGLEVSSHLEGEIVVKGPNVTRGYLNREVETAEKIRNGWLHTGDIGYVDSEGFLYVLDRRSDLIISGGENIYPAEIEGVLQSHEGIIEAGVIGWKDEQWGQVPIAFVVTEKGNSISGPDLISFCQQKLAKYKVPKRIVFIDVLPRNASNKLMRRKLREELEKDE